MKPYQLKSFWIQVFQEFEASEADYSAFMCVRSDVFADWWHNSKFQDWVKSKALMFLIEIKNLDFSVQEQTLLFSSASNFARKDGIEIRRNFILWMIENTQA